MTETSETVTARVTKTQKEYLEMQDKPNSEALRDLIDAARQGDSNDTRVAGMEMQYQREKDNVEELETQLKNAKQRLEKVQDLYEPPEEREHEDIREFAETLTEAGACITTPDQPRLKELADLHFDGEVSATAEAVNDVAVNDLGSDMVVVLR